MAIGQNPFAQAVSPFGAAAANAAGKAIADQQINAINDSFSALSNTPAGMQSVSDANGNISTVSNNASIAAQNMAEFGIADVDAPDISSSGDVGIGGPSGGGGGGDGGYGSGEVGYDAGDMGHGGGGGDSGGGGGGGVWWRWRW